MSSCAHLLRRAVLQHAPQRHGLMQPATSRNKYHETRTAPTEDQLHRHLVGEITLAVPATSHDLASCIVYDIDGEGLVTITALLETVRQRGLWAWGEWHLATDRGYVWIPFDRLTSAAALAQLGDEFAAATPLSPAQRRTLDNRTKNHAITRLPFGRHTRTGQRGDLIFQDGTSATLDADPEAALALWEGRYQENPASQVALEATAPAAPRTTKPACHNKNTILIPASGIQQRYNAAHDVGTILQAAGGRPATRTSWHCPCGHHRNGDQTPSLRICTPKRDLYGETIVQGYSPSCLFHSPTDVFDAFNVYRLLHGLSNAEMLQHARQELGLAFTDRPQTHQRDSEGAQTRPTSRPVAQRPNQSMIAPPQDAPSAADVLARAGSDCCLSPATRTILTTILAILDDRPTARIRLATLISQTGLARRTIQAALRRLETAGYLLIAPQENEWGGHVANQYTLSAGGGRSKRSPLNIKACKGGQPAQPSAEPTATAPAPAPSPAPAAAPVRVDGAKSIFPQKVTLQHMHADADAPHRAETASDQAAPHAAPVPVPNVDIPPPLHAQPALEVSQADEEGPGATFDPVGYEAWAATLDPTTERPWTYSRSPREIMQGHEYGLAELKRSQAERGPLVASPPPPPEVAAPRLRQTTIRLMAPTIAPAPVAGVQALRAELARLEREARRYFAQQAPTAGRQTQQRAAVVRRQLAELEASAASRPVAGMIEPTTAERGQIPCPEKPKKRRKQPQQFVIAT